MHKTKESEMEAGVTKGYIEELRGLNRATITRTPMIYHIRILWQLNLNSLTSLTANYTLRWGRFPAILWALTYLSESYYVRGIISYLGVYNEA